MNRYLITASTTSGRTYEAVYDAPSKRHALALRALVASRHGGTWDRISGTAWRAANTPDGLRATFREDRLWHFERWDPMRQRYVETGSARTLPPDCRHELRSAGRLIAQQETTA